MRRRVIKKNETNEDKEHVVVPIANQQNLKSDRKSVLAKREDVGDSPATQHQWEKLRRLEEQQNAGLAPTKEGLPVKELTQLLNQQTLNLEEVGESENSVGQLTDSREEIVEFQEELQEQLTDDTQQVEREPSFVQELASESVEEATFEMAPEQELVPEQEPIYVSAKILKSIENLFDWNDALAYRQFRLAMHEFNTRLDIETKKIWSQSIKQSINKVKEYIDHIHYVSKGVPYMENTDNLLKDIFASDLQKLQPLDMFVETIAPPEYELGEIVAEIKKEIKNGTRVSYKMIQELQTQLEAMQHTPLETVTTDDRNLALPEAAITSQQQLIDLTAELEGMKKRHKQSVQLMIKAIDMLDLIRNSAMQSNLDHSWIEQIEQAINAYLKELEVFGIKEIKALGELLDGNYMVSIGSMPPEAAPGYEKYQVCLVNERGYLEASTGKVIREAKVMSVY